MRVVNKLKQVATTLEPPKGEYHREHPIGHRRRDRRSDVDGWSRERRDAEGERALRSSHHLGLQLQHMWASRATPLHPQPPPQPQPQ